MSHSQLDILIPAYNEAANLPHLLRRLHASLSSAGIAYHAYIIDDRSRDRTKPVVAALSKKYPVTYLLKQGRQGKAFSLVEAVPHTTAPILAMIDADLEYPPEALPQMYRQFPEFGLVVADRITSHASFIRRFGSRFNRFIFGHLLLGLSVDTQSGMKAFRRDIIENLPAEELQAWAIDVPLISTAMSLGYSIGSVPISFTPRVAGNSQLRKEFLSATRQIVASSLSARLRSRRVLPIHPTSQDSSVGAGVIYKRSRFVTHSLLPHTDSALQTFGTWQKHLLLSLLAAVILGFIFFPLYTGIAIVGFLTLIYFLDVVFSLFVVLKSLHFPPELAFGDHDLKALKTQNLPSYTILCPLYKEAGVLPEFVANISRLNWPKSKLDVVLLLEADDAETIAAAANLPSYFRVLVVPHSFPKTKPKACNYGLAHTDSEFVVIYDAEDRPDPDQLQKAYLAFRSSPENTVCVQAKLNYYNPHQNLLTRFFTAEYSLWFDVVLPGLQSVRTTIPLGGTSNHFRTAVLKSLHGWDAFNVTEDCDLGSRLFRHGYQTALIDSVTLEEANSQVGNWLRQRSRWIKGYLQTYFVHTRNLPRFIKTHGWHALIFQLVIGLRMSFMVINPFLWLMTIAYFSAYSLVGPAIETLFPTAIFYLGAFSLVFGNFLYLYYYMIGAAKRGYWSVIKFVYLVPIYWILTSLAAWKAFYQLLVKPHYWEKTQHGLHLAKPVAAAVPLVPKLARRISFWPSWFGSPVASGAFLGVSNLVSNVAGFIYTIYIARVLSLAELGQVGVFASLLYLANIPSGSLTNTVSYRSAFLSGKYGGPIKLFWEFVTRRISIISLGLVVIWLALIPVLQTLFQVDTPILFLVFAPVWFLVPFAGVSGGFLAGNLGFFTLGWIGIVESLVKLVLAVGLVSLGLSGYIYLATSLSLIIPAALSWLAARRLPETATAQPDNRSALYFPKHYLGSSLLTSLSYFAFLSLDVLLAKIFLSPEAAGQYVLLSTIGKIIYLLGSLITQFVIPAVSRLEGQGTSSKRVFYQILAAASLVSISGFVFFGIFGHLTAPLLFGPNSSAVVSLLPWYTAAMTFFTLGAAIVDYHQARHQYLHSLYGFLVSLIPAVGIWFIHSHLAQLVNIMFISGLVYLLGSVLLHIFHPRFQVLFSNLKDFAGLFSGSNPPNASSGSLRILVFNWRDESHKWAGGAEVYVQEMARRWVAAGHQVTLFCGNDGHQARTSIVDGVTIIRRGGHFSVYIWAAVYYLFKFRGRFDCLIDSENGIPFFTPLYARIPKFLLIHHIHQDIYIYSGRVPKLLGRLAMFLESRLMPLVYRNQRIITVSESSKQDILNLGWSNSAQIDIVSPGIDTSLFTPGSKSKKPLFAFVGRIRPYKNLDVAIRAFAPIAAEFPGSRLVIGGIGENLDELKSLTHQLKLQDSVKFLGRVSEADKISLIQSSWAMLQPSSFEGWGITVIEAAACGTASLASDVAGLRDSVIHHRTGLLVPLGNVDSWTDAMRRIIREPNLRRSLGKSGVPWAKDHDWHIQSSRLHKLLVSSLENKLIAVPALAVAE